MTVVSELSAVTRSWTGVETLFETGFVARSATHVRVRTSAGVTLTRGTHYTSQLSVTRTMQIIPLPGMPAAPLTLEIERVTPATQESNLVNGDTWDMEAFEQELDASALRDAETRRDATVARDKADYVFNLIGAILAIGPVQRVNGKVGDVSLVPADIGLGNVANTSDAQKVASGPIADALATRPILRSPSINTGFTGARTRQGLVLGPTRWSQDGNAPIDAFVMQYIDETFDNVGQEVRGNTSTLRNTRTTPDEAVYGWDYIPYSGANVITQYNTQYIRGVMKAAQFENILEMPLTGNYAARTMLGALATLAIGANVDVERWVGYRVGAPLALEGGFDTPVLTPETRIQIGYGLEIDEIRGRVAKAGIKFNGRGNGGRLVWGSTHLTEDTSGKMEINLGSTFLSLVNPLLGGTLLTTGSIAIPANAHALLRILVNGDGFAIPLIRTA